MEKAENKSLIGLFFKKKRNIQKAHTQRDCFYTLSAGFLELSKDL